MEYKYLIIVKDGIIEVDEEIYQNILRKEKSTRLKETKKILKKFKEEYPGKEIIVKEYFKGKWKEVNI